jgi:hypothetical protein
MIENYMDYSSEPCQNSFTNDQSLFMRWVLAGFRPDVARPSLVGINDRESVAFEISPNPGDGLFTIKGKHAIHAIEVFSMVGEKLMHVNSTNHINLESLPAGLYLLRINDTQVHRVVKR